MATTIYKETTLLDYMTTNGTAHLDKIALYQMIQDPGGDYAEIVSTPQTITWDGGGSASTDYTFTITAGNSVHGVFLLDSSIGVATADAVIGVSLDSPVYLANGGQFIVQSTTLSF